MERTFTQIALAAALMTCLSQGAFAGGINSPNGVPVEIGAGGLANIVTVTQDGRVGIENTLPAYTLDVNGDTNIGGNLYVLGQQNTGTRIFMQRDGSNYSWIGAQGTATDAERDAVGILSEPGTGKIDGVVINPSLAVGGSVKLGNDTNDCTATNTGALRWSGTAFEGCNGTAWVSLSLPTCVQRQATSATMSACGFGSHVECQPGETAFSGGAIVGNGALAQSYAETDVSGNIAGWQMAALNIGTSNCTINDYNHYGDVATATPPALPCFPIDGRGTTICGAATVICCH